MPFNKDTRCGTIHVTLNVGSILEEIEQMLEQEYHEPINRGSKFWLYVIELENSYTSHINSHIHTQLKFWDWFVDNYNNMEEWNNIEEYFISEESEEEEEKE